MVLDVEAGQVIQLKDVTEVYQNHENTLCSSPLSSHIVNSKVCSSNPNSEVQQFYNGRSLFITGATGYIGKVLIFKLLNDCPDIKRIYLLLRSKRGFTFEARKARFLQYDMFKFLRDPSVLGKLIFVEGSVEQEWLGIEDGLRSTIIEEVSVVFHSAASVDLTSGHKVVDVASKSNLRGTINVLSMCRQMNNLACCVYVSTATVYPYKDLIGEEIYPLDLTADQFLAVISSDDKKQIKQLLERDLKQFPNPYTLTKALAENLCQIETRNFPICIVRPPIVSSAVGTPCVGWTNKMQAFTSIVLLWVMGLGRCMTWDPNTPIQIAPVDYVCNVLIVSAQKTFRKRCTSPNDKFDVPVYNVVPSEHNQVTWQGLLDLSQSFVYDSPSIKALRWPPGQLISPKNPLKLMYSIIFQHIVFSIFIDLLLLITGKKPQVVSLMLKMFRTTNSVKWFVTKKWQFVNRNFRSLYDGLNDVDKKIFPMSLHDMNWKEYSRSSYYGLRQFVLQEDESMTKRAIIRLRRLTLLTNLSIALILILLVSIPILLFFIIR